jgi:hypothetical protein
VEQPTKKVAGSAAKTEREAKVGGNGIVLVVLAEPKKQY